MIDRKLATICALLLTTGALAACGSDGGSGDTTASPPSPEQQAPKPKPIPKPEGGSKPKADSTGGGQAAKPQGDSNGTAGEQRTKAPRADEGPPRRKKAADPQAEKAEEGSPSNPLPQSRACTKDPQSRQCEDERRASRQDDPPEPQMHGDEPAEESPDCEKPGGCGGNREPHS